MIYRVPVSVVPVVSNVGHIKYRHGWTTEYCHRRNVFIFIVSGEFTFVFRERRTTVRAGCYQVIPAGTPYRVSAGDDCDYYYAHFSASVPLKSVSKEEAKSALESLKSGRELPELAENDESTCIFLPETGSFGENTESMKYRFSRVEMYFSGKTATDTLRLRSSFLALLLAAAAFTEDEFVEKEHMPAALSKITGYIDDSFTTRVTLASLSSEFGFSKQYIMRLFHDNLGTTVTKYINDVKLEKSLDLLRCTGLSVGEIAYSLGYSNTYYFCRIFKTKYSMTPTEYQKKIRSIE